MCGSCTRNSPQLKTLTLPPFAGTGLLQALGWLLALPLEAAVAAAGADAAGECGPSEVAAEDADPAALRRAGAALQAGAAAAAAEVISLRASLHEPCMHCCAD